MTGMAITSVSCLGSCLILSMARHPKVAEAASAPARRGGSPGASRPSRR